MSDVDISNVITENIGMTPYDIENRLKLRNHLFRYCILWSYGKKVINYQKEFTSLDGNHISYDVKNYLPGRN